MADFTGQVKQGIDTVADKAKQATDRVAGAAGQVQHKAHDMGRQAEGGVRAAVDTVQEKAGEWADDAVHAAKQAGDRVGHWAHDAYDSVRDVNVSDFGSELTSMIRKHPVPALLIGFGVGLLIGRAAKA